MARTEVSVQTITRAGLSVSTEAGTTDGHFFGNDGRTVLRLENTDTTAHDVTIQSSYTQHGLTLPNQVVSVGAGSVLWVGPWPVETFGAPVNVDYASPANMTVAAVKVIGG